jgi:hypothetical protein
MTSQRHIQSLCSRMDDHKRLMLSIAQSDDVAVGRIIHTALQNGAGIETIIDRIVKAQEGLFSPHTYSVCANFLRLYWRDILTWHISKSRST